MPFLADAFSYIFSLVSLLAMRTPVQEQRERDTATWRTQALEGLRWLCRHAFLRTCALLFGASNFAWNGVFLIVVVAGREEGLSSAAIGAVIAAGAEAYVARPTVYALVAGLIPCVS